MPRGFKVFKVRRGLKERLVSQAPPAHKAFKVRRAFVVIRERKDRRELLAPPEHKARLAYRVTPE